MFSTSQTLTIARLIGEQAPYCPLEIKVTLLDDEATLMVHNEGAYNWWTVNVAGTVIDFEQS